MKNLVPELTEAKNDISEIFVDVAEQHLDAITDSLVIQNLPLIKTVSAVAKGIVGVRNQYQLYMIAQFLNTVNSGVATPGDINAHEEALRLNPRQLQKEVSYILVNIDSWTDSKKSEYFGRLYIAYITKKILWDRFTLYTEILRQITMYDINTLREIYKKYKYGENDIPPFESMLRLQSLGLVIFHDGYVRQTSKNPISGNVKRERGHITGEGKAFYKLITESKII